MSIRLGFADAVRRYGDQWRAASCDFRQAERRAADAMLMADGRIRDDQREALRMADCVTHDPIAISAAECLGMIFSGKKA